jgi:hypothetical protein
MACRPKAWSIPRKSGELCPFRSQLNLRLFSFGVGYDVDTVLLDSLAQEHHG